MTSILFLSPLFFIFFFCLIFSAVVSFAYEARNPEVENLISIRSGLKDPHGALSNWDEDSVDPCSWSMITCSPDNTVTSFGAPSQGLSGNLSGRIANLTNLRQVLLQNNNITGEIPPGLGNLRNLQTLDLSNNKFFGSIPDSLGFLNDLQYLRLNNNSLSGAIPQTILTKLTFLDLSFNNLSGPVAKFPATAFSFVGNPLICGRLSPGNCFGLAPYPLSFSLQSSSGKSKSKRLAISLGLSSGLISLIFLALGILLWQRSKKRKHSILIDDMQEEILSSLGNLRSFTFKELYHATNSYSSKSIVGVGGFGNVYKGKLEDGTVVAVKRLKDVNGKTGELQFQTELKMISLAVHRNLLRLIGYCATPDERLLVYPYMCNGSVALRLRGKPTLDWNARKKIAVGTARGLLYLHEQCDPKIIHRDVKAANVLLDEFGEAVVGDFGLAKLLNHADSHVTTAVRGTVGHIAPEYLSTGQSSEKTDVFGFGILLVELITGLRTLQLEKTVNQKGIMLDWIKKANEEKKVEVLVDKELGSNYDRIEVSEMLQVALLCTQYLPSHRPKMSEVVRMLEGDGLAEKWAASHNNMNCKSTFSHSKRTQSHLGTYSKHEGHDHDPSSSFGMIMMDDDHDTYAMELSGPR
ncbi:hypothetical protein ACET3Z_010070 [Daucus carota]